jgi:hypothetical protein
MSSGEPQKEPATAGSSETEGRSHQVRLPGFILEEEVGLGDVIKRVTSAAGIAPCGGCTRRAAALNRWLMFSTRNRRR